jgi:DNA primase
VAQCLKLSALNKPVVVAFDNDEPGRNAARELLPVLRREGVRAVVKHPPTEFKDVGEMPAAAVTEWLAT